MSTDIPICKTDHIPSWLVIYDIGKNKTEQIFVCKNCFENPDDDCFRLYVISKTPAGEKVSQ